MTDRTSEVNPGHRDEESGRTQHHDGHHEDPLRGSWTSKTWSAVTALAVLLVLLIVFIAQNTDPVPLNLFGWTWHPPLAVAILASVAGGLLIAVCAGTLRILQLRRRVRRTKRAGADAV